MLFNYRYSGDTSVSNSRAAMTMNFAPDTSREPTFFTGKLNKKIPFREAISALHDVVISDLRFHPKDKTAYKQWAAEQEKIWLSDYIAGFQIEKVRNRIQQIRKELSQLYHEKEQMLGPFHKARKAYFDYLYQKDKDAWFILDPVITVHPDEVFFECFSQDESSYGKLSCSYNVFTAISDFKCGTTNIDYSAALYGEFQKIRNYKDTEFRIDPAGFETTTTHEATYKEVKVDLPESWVRGFLQVSTAMTLPATTFDLHPMDIFSLCQYLRRFREKEGPRALRFILEPGQPVKVLLEPWYETLTFHRSPYAGSKPQTIRIWGRRRLMILERLIPVARNFKVALLGSGLPSFFIADLGDMTFTLGLSGWTVNDWSRAGHFDLMAPRGYTDPATRQLVFDTLKADWFSSSEQLARKLNLSPAVVSSALTAYTQAGSVIYDLNAGVYRVRELSRKPLDLSVLRFSNEREEAANTYVELNQVSTEYRIVNDLLHISGKIKSSKGILRTTAVIDKDHRLTDASCDCSFFLSNHLRKGPCEHILATRMQFQRTRRTAAIPAS